MTQRVPPHPANKKQYRQWHNAKDFKLYGARQQRLHEQPCIEIDDSEDTYQTEFLPCSQFSLVYNRWIT